MASTLERVVNSPDTGGHVYTDGRTPVMQWYTSADPSTPAFELLADGTVTHGGSLGGAPTTGTSTLANAAATIRKDVDVVFIINTSGGPLTLTTNPPIADGINSQELSVINQSADSVTFLGVTVAQGQGAIFIYSSVLDQWVPMSSLGAASDMPAHLAAVDPHGDRAYSVQRVNHTGTQTASTISNFDTQVRTSRLDQMAAPNANVPWASHKITGLLDGTGAQDAAAFGQIGTAIDAMMADTTDVTADLAVGAATTLFDAFLVVQGGALVWTVPSQIGAYVAANHVAGTYAPLASPVFTTGIQVQQSNTAYPVWKTITYLGQNALGLFNNQADAAAYVGIGSGAQPAVVLDVFGRGLISVGLGGTGNALEATLTASGTHSGWWTCPTGGYSGAATWVPTADFDGAPKKYVDVWTLGQTTTADITLVLADQGTLIEANSSSTINITPPTNASVAFPIGTKIRIRRIGTGAVNVLTGSVTLNTPAGYAASIRSQHGEISLTKRSTNIWELGGDLTQIKRVTTTTSSATPTTNTDNCDIHRITALAAAMTSATTNLSGTATYGQRLEFHITDNGTARALTWGASFTASGNVPLPTTTVTSVTLYVQFTHNGTTWVCTGVA